MGPDPLRAGGRDDRADLLVLDDRVLHQRDEQQPLRPLRVVRPQRDAAGPPHRLGQRQAHVAAEEDHRGARDHGRACEGHRGGAAQG